MQCEYVDIMLLNVIVSGYQYDFCELNTARFLWIKHHLTRCITILTWHLMQEFCFVWVRLCLLLLRRLCEVVACDGGCLRLTPEQFSLIQVAECSHAQCVS